MSGLHCESFVFSWVLIIKSLFKTSSFVCPWLKETLLVKMKRSIESWNESSMCYVQNVWFGSKGKVGPWYIGLILEASISLGPSRVHARGT